MTIPTGTCKIPYLIPKVCAGFSTGTKYNLKPINILIININIVNIINIDLEKA
jgi:hypothetical protein